jgi:hypothetical protein
MGQWSSGYDVALTTRRPPVRFRPGPFTSLRGVPVETEVFWQFVGFRVFSPSCDGSASLTPSPVF